MLNFDNVISQYPPRLRGFKENILKEYLQYRILEIIYSSKFAGNLIFLGGTAIRIVHQGTRFSEDLDFDNRGLNEKDFESIAGIIGSELELDGYSVSINNIFKGAYHCYVRFPGLLYEQGLTGHKQERILIQIDAEPQNYEYEAENYLINKFGLFRYIKTVPKAILLSQKILASLNRKRAMGRDFFDVVFLMSLTEPDYSFLKKKAAIENKETLISSLRARVKDLNMKELADEVEPFLFDPSQKDRITFFADWLGRI